MQAYLTTPIKPIKRYSAGVAGGFSQSAQVGEYGYDPNTSQKGGEGKQSVLSPFSKMRPRSPPLSGTASEYAAGPCHTTRGAAQLRASSCETRTAIVSRTVLLAGPVYTMRLRPSGAPASRATAPTMQLLVGCRDRAEVVAAAVRVLGAAGESVAVVVPDGCCGGVLRDLGATEAAADATATLATRLRPDVPVVLLDPHCHDTVDGLDADRAVEDLVAVLHRLVESGDLDLDGAPETVRWHEPCLLVDGPAAGAGPAVLAGVGSLVELPGEAHRGCSGAGLGMELLDEEAAETVARQRRAMLAGPGPIVTGCAGAAARLSTDDEPALHLVQLLDDLLDDDPESVA